MTRQVSRTMERLPLLLFLVMYVFSCYIGVLLLLSSDKFWAWTDLFSGPSLMPLDVTSFRVLIILLHLGPLLFWLGYELALVASRRLWKWELFTEIEDKRSVERLSFILFAVSVTIAVFSLARGGAFSRLWVWSDYNAYVRARWHLFATLTFLEYVNLYTWLPLSAAFLLLCRRRWWMFGLVIGIVTFLQLSLFLKKSLLTSLVLISCTLWAYWLSGGASRRTVRYGAWTKYGLALSCSLYLVHSALTIRLVSSASAGAFVSEQADEVSQAKTGAASEAGVPPSAAPGSPPRVSPGILSSAPSPVSPVIVKFDKQPNPLRSGKGVVLYAIFSPLTRTSVPAIAYAELFPQKVPFYHVDVALDMLGLGRMPDDNLVVNDILWPYQKGGSVAVPFHFVLYSQGGLPIALLGSFLVGSFFSAVWYPLSRSRRLSMTGSLLAGLLLTFAWLNAIDSLRNNFLASYGVFWGALPVVVIYLWAEGNRRQRESL
jgi:hypothetical protein